MKFKAVTNKEAPVALIEAFDTLRWRLEREVARDCLKIPVNSMGPAEMYVQESDFTRGQRAFVNYNLSGVSIKEGREFEKAVQVLEAIVVELVRQHWQSAGEVQVMIVIAASSEQGESRLFENEAFYLDSTTGERIVK